MAERAASRIRRVLAAGLFACLTPGRSLPAQSTDSVVAAIENAYAVTANVVYRTAGNVDLRLDVFQPRRAPGPLPTVVYFFGGGWVVGSKERAVMRLLPWLAKGWVVVNVDYRLAKTALAPAAVEDARCALAWVIANARANHVDTSRVVVSGHSAGAHLALMAGFAPKAAGLDRECSGYGAPARPAAVVSWYAPTDLHDIADGPAGTDFLARWLGGQPDREALARRLSPLTWVRPGLPPVILIHGDRDSTVPYRSATDLKAALDRADVVNELVTIPGGGHGDWAPAEWLRAERAVTQFLDRLRIGLADSTRRMLFEGRPRGS